MKPGELFITISTWEGFQLIKTEEGTWFPKLEFKGLAPGGGFVWR